MKAILVTGTPGTGKTTVAKKLSTEFDYQYVDVKAVIKEHHLDEKFDNKRKCHIIDEQKLAQVLVKSIETSQKKLVIDSHLCQYIPKKYVELCIVTKCELKELKNRLEKRKYATAKVKENMDCEIFDICLTEAKEAGHKVFIVDTTTGFDIKKIKKKIKILHQDVGF